MTVPASLRELEKIEMVRRNKELYRLDHAVSKKQKIFLSAFGLDVDAVRSTAAHLGRLLAKTAELPQQDEEE